MFWTILFLAFKYLAAILAIYAIAEFITRKAIRDYEAEKKKEAIRHIPHIRKGC